MRCDHLHRKSFKKIRNSVSASLILKDGAVRRRVTSPCVIQEKKKKEVVVV